MKEKALIIGASTVGKTTLVNYLRTTTDFSVGESDEEIIKMNGGTWPTEDGVKMNVYAPRMVEDILGRDPIIFFSNTHYFNLDAIQKAKENGFSIFHLILNREKMSERSDFRRKNEGYEDHTKYFESMLAYQNELSKSGLVDLEINTDKPVAEIANEILQSLESKSI